jgi:hypothetical protein
VSRRRWGLLFAACALIAVAGGGGGFRAPAAAAFQTCALLAAAFAASLPARPAPGLTGILGAALAGSSLLSAALAPYRFASLDRWALWSAALLLAWSVARLERASADHESGRRSCSRFVLAASLGLLFLQVAGEFGLHFGGSPDGLSGVSLHGSFTSRNHLAETLVLLVVASLPFVSLRGLRGRAHVAVALMSGLGVALAGSRIAPIALACALGTWALSRVRLRSLPRPALLLGALAGLLLVGAAAGVILTRNHEGDAWRRPQIWAAVAPAALERPLLGLGPGSYRHAHHPYSFPVESRVGRLTNHPSTPHGEWLRIPIELGLLGSLLLLLLLASRLRGSGRLGAWPVLAGLLPLAAVHDILNSPAVAAWTAVVLVTWQAREEEGERTPAWLSAEAPERSLALALAATVALGGLVLRPTWADGAARGQDFGAALTWNPGQPFHWLRAGEQALAGGAHPERQALAMLYFEEAEALAARLPGPPRARARLLSDAARLYLQDAAGRDAAARAWGRAAARSPWDARLLVEPAVFLVQTGAADRAWPLAERALELEPRYVDAALTALIARRADGVAEEAALARVEELLARLPALRTLASTDYERDLLEPDERLLDAAGLTDRSSQ